jgi:hypothetical protein
MATRAKATATTKKKGTAGAKTKTPKTKTKRSPKAGTANVNKKSTPSTAPGRRSFAAVVRKAMAEALPAYRFLETAGGSGPLVSFERPNPAASRGLREQVVFQKGLHGADWFRVNLFPMFEGTAAVGTTEHALWEGETLGPEVRWEDDAKLESAIAEACRTLEKKAAAFFAPFEKLAPKYGVLLGRLVEHYAAWLDAEGKNLPPQDFKDNDEGKIAAYETFRRWLDRKKLTAGLKGDLDTCLWRFWNAARPMRTVDYDKGDYYYCSQCPAFIRPARGRLVKHKVTGFGDHFALVCTKH